MSKELVVLSGGQDSGTLLADMAKRVKPADRYAVTYYYGQRHGVEVECASRLAEHFETPHEVLNIGQILQVAGSALIGEKEPVGGKHALKPHLPNTWVPNRNAILFALAHAYAQRLKVKIIHVGINATDYSGYPDCRPEFIEPFGNALNIGAECLIAFSAPLLRLTKAETFAWAARLGELETILELTHTCYNGDHETRHPWGYGCGECDACKLRRKGWEEFQATII